MKAPTCDGKGSFNSDEPAARDIRASGEINARNGPDRDREAYNKPIRGTGVGREYHGLGLAGRLDLNCPGREPAEYFTGDVQRRTALRALRTYRSWASACLRDLTVSGRAWSM